MPLWWVQAYAEIMSHATQSWSVCSLVLLCWRRSRMHWQPQDPSLLLPHWLALSARRAVLRPLMVPRQRRQKNKKDLKHHCHQQTRLLTQCLQAEHWQQQRRQSRARLSLQPASLQSAQKGRCSTAGMIWGRTLTLRSMQLRMKEAKRRKTRSRLLMTQSLCRPAQPGRAAAKNIE